MYKPSTPFILQFSGLVFMFLLLTVFVLLSKLPVPYNPRPVPSQGVVMPATGSDVNNASYAVEQTQVTLVRGRAEQPFAPGTVNKIITQVWGEPAVGDLNDDGVNDTAVILTQSSGGSGIFYYIAAALTRPGGLVQGTNAVFLGDRIAPQNLSIVLDVIHVNYAERKAGEPMSTQPSVGRTAYFVVSGTKLERLLPNSGGLRPVELP